MEDDLRTGTPYRISCLRQQPSGVDRRCQIWPIRGYTRFWYTGTASFEKISQAFPRPLPQSPLVFFPLLCSLYFSLALHYLNAWNRLPLDLFCNLPLPITSCVKTYETYEMELWWLLLLADIFRRQNVEVSKCD